ncbi:MAG: hypothetical protein VYA51_00580 [Planctomycetota bacterium]|nr:hypothetical protein [Planctomycetota bacterium]
MIKALSAVCVSFLLLATTAAGRVWTPASGFPETAMDYVAMIEPLLGVPPRVDLGDAVEIPIYVDGEQRYGNLGRKCDNPSFLGKATASGSTLQRYEGRTRDGERLPDVIWIAFGRNSSTSRDRVVGSVQMIGYHKKTGATAFFESCDRVGPWVTLDETTWRMRGVMPWIDEPRAFNQAFRTPGEVQCVQCHQADPFITNTFINAAKIPGTAETVVPKLDEESPYYVIGGEHWDMRTLHIEGNQCMDCHRVGMSTVDLFLPNGWHPDKYMPPRDPGSLNEDWQELRRVWEQGPESVEGADWIVPPRDGAPAEVVGADYPHKAWFNRPGANRYGVVQGKDGVAEKGGDAARGVTRAKRGRRSKQKAAEAQRLLRKLGDPATRRAWARWFDENGYDDEALAKLRREVAGKGK